MSLIERIRTDQRTARILSRAENGRLKASLLTTLLGEIGRVKDASAGEPTDAEVTAVIRKMVKNTDEVLKHRPDSAGVHVERAILMSYLPTPLSDDEVRSFIAVQSVVQNPSMKDMKTLLGLLEASYPGQVTGDQLARVLKSL